MTPAALATSSDLLAALLPEWQLLLQGWSASGQLTAAAREALVLKADPPALTALVSQWSAGDFTGLPPIVLLSGADMAGAMGAYAISTGTIYLNADWLATANKDQVLAVLTEELGHHLDGLLNSVDTPGDEGEYFAALLQGNGVISAQQHEELLAKNDKSSVMVNGQPIAAEHATTPAPVISSIGGTDSIISNTTDDRQIIGTAAAGSTVRFHIGIDRYGPIYLEGSTTATSSGTFAFSIGLTNLMYTLGQGTGKRIFAIATDTAGNTSASSAAFTFAV